MRVRIVVHETAPNQWLGLIPPTRAEVAVPRGSAPTSRDRYKGDLVTYRLMLASRKYKQEITRPTLAQGREKES